MKINKKFNLFLSSLFLLSLAILAYNFNSFFHSKYPKNSRFPEVIGQETENLNSTSSNSNDFSAISNQNLNEKDGKDSFSQLFSLGKGVEQSQLGDLVVTKNKEFLIAENSIGSKNIKWHTIKSQDIGKGSVTSRTIKNATIKSQDLSSNLTIKYLKIKHRLDLNDSLTIGNGSPSHFTLGSGDVYSSGNFESEGDVYLDGTFSISESGVDSQYSTIFQGGDQATNITYTLPTTQAVAADYYLRNDGNGNLSWQVPHILDTDSQI